MKLDREKLYPWLAILRAKYMGSTRAIKLENHFGSIGNALKAPAEAIAAVPGFSIEIGQAVVEAGKGTFDREIENEFNWAEKNGIKMMLYSDEGYPPLLRHIPAYPAFLHIKGEYKQTDLLSIGIVGSRRATDSAKRMANKIACELAEAGLTITSGLAWGVDASAHKGALRCKQGRTLAVLGNGLKFIYPREHQNLSEQIVNRGALITELFYDVSPQGRNFPPRNRIISGLSLGVVIVEAPSRSGALITADYALEQGREVFALPGGAETETSPGTNRLIKESQAKLITSAADILEELEDKITYYRNELEGKIPRVDLMAPGKRPPDKKPIQTIESPIQTKETTAPSSPEQPPPKTEKTLPPLNDDEKTVYQTLTDNPIHIDSVCRNLQWPAARVSSALGLLELKGLVERESGMRFRVAD